jgi:hypothetical protein
MITVNIKFCFELGDNAGTDEKSVPALSGVSCSDHEA